MKVSQESVYRKKHVKFAITDKSGNLKVKIKASFCKAVVATALKFEIL